ncbi:MAG TPA: hypothetical protein VFZ51_05130 [Woeseiaceae bacterium]
MKATALMVLLMLWGCASEVPGTRERSESEYREVDTRLEAAEEFELRKQRCAEAGGVLQVRRMSGSRQPPRVREMKTASCALAPGSAGIF